MLPVILRRLLSYLIKSFQFFCKKIYYSCFLDFNFFVCLYISIEIYFKLFDKISILRISTCSNDYIVFLTLHRALLTYFTNNLLLFFVALRDMRDILRHIGDIYSSRQIFWSKSNNSSNGNSTASKNHHSLVKPVAFLPAFLPYKQLAPKYNKQPSLK